MTAILGYADGKHVWIGGDSSAQNGHWSRIAIRERKVFRIGEMLVGGAGLMRPIQAIRTGLKLPEHAAEMPDLDYFITAFIPAMQQALADGKASMDDQDGNSTSLMIGYHGVLYCMGSDFSIRAHEAQAYALGNGGDIAFGAFIAYHFAVETVEMAMDLALTVAANFDLTVAPPFYVEMI